MTRVTQRHGPDCHIENDGAWVCLCGLHEKRLAAALIRNQCLKLEGIAETLEANHQESECSLVRKAIGNIRFSLDVLIEKTR